MLKTCTSAMLFADIALVLDCNVSALLPAATNSPAHCNVTTQLSAAIISHKAADVTPQPLYCHPLASTLLFKMLQCISKTHSLSSKHVCTQQAGAGQGPGQVVSGHCHKCKGPICPRAACPQRLDVSLGPACPTCPCTGWVILPAAFHCMLD